MTSYPIDLTPDDNGTWLITCRDLPEVTSWSELSAGDGTEAHATALAAVLDRAANAVEEAVAARLSDWQPIPVPSPAHGGLAATISTQLALKVELARTLQASGLTRADLTRRLGWHRPQVDRLFNPDHATRLEQYDAAFRALGRRIEATVAALDAA